MRGLAGSPYTPPGPPGGDQPLALLVIGGSQGARILSDVVPEAILALPADLRPRLRLSQQVREEDLARVSARYDGAGVRADLRTFFTDLPERMAEAHLVISRAGASSLADIAAIGRPAILVPYAAATANHQAANARALAAAGAALVIEEAGLTPETLAAAIGGILADPGRAAAMAAAARAEGRPEAARDLAAMVESLAPPAARPGVTPMDGRPG